MTVKLTDFGIARAAEQTRLTQVGSVVGTAAYLAPEQARGEEAAPASDVYALGVVIYQLLTGRLPWEGSSLAELAIRRENERPLPPTSYDPAVPESCRRRSSIPGGRPGPSLLHRPPARHGAARRARGPAAPPGRRRRAHPGAGRANRGHPAPGAQQAARRAASSPPPRPAAPRPAPTLMRPGAAAPLAGSRRAAPSA